VEEREIKKDGKGRPMKVYKLTITLGDIIKYFEDEKRRESAKTMESIEKLKEMSRSLSEESPSA
jgi:predicted transcriptional regulator